MFSIGDDVGIGKQAPPAIWSRRIFEYNSRVYKLAFEGPGCSVDDNHHPSAHTLLLSGYEPRREAVVKSVSSTRAHPRINHSPGVSTPIPRLAGFLAVRLRLYAFWVSTRCVSTRLCVSTPFVAF